MRSDRTLLKVRLEVDLAIYPGEYTRWEKDVRELPLVVLLGVWNDYIADQRVGIMMTENERAMFEAEPTIFTRAEETLKKK